VHLKSGLIRGVASLMGGNLIIIYYLCASEIWSEKRDSLLVRVAYKEGELLFETTRFKCNICKNTNGKYVNMIVLCMVTMIAKMF
jgi:hypothetical protein